ncbi:MAG: UbiD family decarboxylase [Alphaproteobacteria bacterium]|nr:UbiD family decarboxylase [Alphaproteobacteria bacterium]
MSDLRTFLSDEAAHVWRPEGPVSLAYEITALQQALDARQQYPVIEVRQPRGADGAINPIPVVCNLTASRELIARALGVQDHRDFAITYAQRTANPIAPVSVTRADAPVQQVVLEGDAANLLELPVLTQHALDAGPYLTSAHATTYDPDTGVDNTAVQRCWVKAPRRMSYYPYPASHNTRNLRKFWAKGEPCPVAFWIGHHPKVLLGTQAKLAYPESHWSACGGLLGEPMRLVPSITHGDKIMVPADAEIVIEGWAPANVWEADGPFGEYTGHTGPQVAAPVCEVTCITRRKDAIYHDFASGHADMLIPDNMVMEGKLYGMIKPIAPSVRRVHVPASGRRFHAYVSFENPGIGEVRDALMATLAYRRTKAIIAVDTDIDIFNESDIMFALATRVQWDRDIISVAGLQGSLMDPSLPRGAKTVQKAGIDATLAPAEIPGAPRPVPPRNSVSAEAMDAAIARLTGVDTKGWPLL